MTSYWFFADSLRLAALTFVEPEEVKRNRLKPVLL
jgi:hypothetical protein